MMNWFNQWKSIKSAPKDGTVILAYEPGNGCAVVKWMKNANAFTDCHGSILRPSVWMKIPKVPK